MFNIFLLFSGSNVCILPYNLLSILKTVYFVHLMIHELYTLRFEKFNGCLKSINLRTVLETSYRKKKWLKFFTIFYISNKNNIKIIQKNNALSASVISLL